MTTHTTSGTFINNTDALFRDWVARVLNALSAVGMVRTADTGQINAATVLRPTTAQTTAGFAIYQFAGPHQATRPLFMRINFGSSTTEAYPGLQVIICKGTNGAGIPTGVLHSTWADTKGVSAAEAPWRASAGDNYCALLPATGTGTMNLGAGMPFILVERSPDGTSVMVVENQRQTNALGSVAVAGVPGVTVIAYDTGAWTNGAVPVVLPFRVAGSVLTGGTPLAAASLGPVFPWVLFPPAQAPWQSRLAVSYPGGDAPGTVFQATLEGEDRSYLPIPLSDAYSAFGLAIGIGADTTASRHVGLAIRWE